jgi:hypothetical protein
VSTIQLVGMAATSTKPVPSVAVIAPSVPMLDSRPTTAPVWRRSPSCSFTTIGVIVESRNAGRKTAIAASSSTAGAAPPRRISPPQRTSGRVIAVPIAARISAGASSLRGSNRSASRPPSHAP